MGIAQFVFEEYEADDIIGTLARKFEDDIRVTLWTKDQDYLQLVDDNVRVWFITPISYEPYQVPGKKRDNRR
jgi:DNA polymerase-1